MSEPSTVDPARCPLCGGMNACAVEAARQTGLPEGPCWCMTEAFDEAILRGVPEKARGLACVCARCAAPGQD